MHTQKSQGHIPTTNSLHEGFVGWACSTTYLNQSPAIKLDSIDVRQKILP